MSHWSFSRFGFYGTSVAIDIKRSFKLGINEQRVLNVRRGGKFVPGFFPSDLCLIRRKFMVYRPLLLAEVVEVYGLS